MRNDLSSIYGYIHRHKLILFGIVWLIAQMILGFYHQPIGFISDEYLYKRIAESLLHFEPAISWHYPILYPLLIAPGLLFGDYFYEAMVCINIIFKGVCLTFIWRLLTKEVDQEKSFFILMLIGFSPIYFLYTRVLFAENLSCPLLIISMLYHNIYRKRQIENVSISKKICLTIIAALLSLSLFWAKYLLLITLPVFCLFWCSIYLKNGMFTRKAFIQFIVTGAVYTMTVLICIIGYALYYALRTNVPFSMEIILGTMGLGVGTGPSYTGFAVLVESKWVISYTMYAFLGVVLNVAGMISMGKLENIRQSKSIFTLGVILITALIYVSARHSTYVSYNEGWRMISLCGRYVAYATPILAIPWIQMCDTRRGNIFLKVGAGAAGCILTLISYEMLYVLSPGVSQSASWLTGLRAADNAGFTNLGLLMCLIYGIAIVTICLTNYKIATFIICIVMCIHSFLAVITCPQYHTRDMTYSSISKHFFREYKDDVIGIICTDSIDYTCLSSNKLYYQIDGNLEKLAILSIVNMEQPLYFEADSYKYFFTVKTDFVDESIYQENRDLFEGSMEEPFVFLKWDASRFVKKQVEEFMVQDVTNNQIKISCMGDSSTIFICGTYILPTSIEGNYVVSIIDKMNLENDTVNIYNMRDLTVSEETVRKGENE